MKFTKERRDIRDLALVAKNRISIFESELRDAKNHLEQIRNECAHPAKKSGHSGGMSYWYCPDCGAGHP